MGEWAVWAEADEPAEEEHDGGEPAEVDASLEARRLSRWLKAMFGGGDRSAADGEPPADRG